VKFKEATGGRGFKKCSMDRRVTNPVAAPEAEARRRSASRQELLSEWLKQSVCRAIAGFPASSSAAKGESDVHFVTPAGRAGRGTEREPTLFSTSSEQQQLARALQVIRQNQWLVHLYEQKQGDTHQLRSAYRSSVSAAATPFSDVVDQLENRRLLTPTILRHQSSLSPDSLSTAAFPRHHQNEHSMLSPNHSELVSSSLLTSLIFDYVTSLPSQQQTSLQPLLHNHIQSGMAFADHPTGPIHHSFSSSSVAVAEESASLQAALFGFSVTAATAGSTTRFSGSRQEPDALDLQPSQGPFGHATAPKRAPCSNNQACKPNQNARLAVQCQQARSFGTGSTLSSTRPRPLARPPAFPNPAEVPVCPPSVISLPRSSPPTACAPVVSMTASIVPTNGQRPECSQEISRSSPSTSSQSVQNTTAVALKNSITQNSIYSFVSSKSLTGYNTVQQAHDAQEHSPPLITGHAVHKKYKDGAHRRRGRNEPTFPVKLYNLLMAVEQEGKEEIISFTPSGRAFFIHQPGRFLHEILPRFFSGQQKLGSFKRQLSVYGFDRIPRGPAEGAYAHPDFLRGQAERVEFIQRAKRGESTARHGEWVPDFTIL